MSIANNMSLFFAHATPMLQSVSGATSRYVVDSKVEVNKMLPKMEKMHFIHTNQKLKIKMETLQKWNWYKMVTQQTE